MSYLIIFVSTGLLLYWIARMMVLLYGSHEQINEILRIDIRWGRRLVLWLRTMFMPPTQLAG